MDSDPFGKEVCQLSASSDRQQTDWKPVSRLMGRSESHSTVVQMSQTDEEPCHYFSMNHLTTDSRYTTSYLLSSLFILEILTEDNKTMNEHLMELSSDQEM